MSNKCVVCGEGGWTGAKYGSHKICYSCWKGGYKFKIRIMPENGRSGILQIVNLENKVIGYKKIYDKRVVI